MMVGSLERGDAVVIMPGGVAALRRSPLERIGDADWQAARDGFGDPDLANG